MITADYDNIMNTVKKVESNGTEFSLKRSNSQKGGKNA